MTDIDAQRRAREEQHRVAEAFQTASFPPCLPTVPGVQFDATYEPVQHDLKIGGDWYDVVHLVDGRILVLIGDVVGNGLEAARHPVTTSLF